MNVEDLGIQLDGGREGLPGAGVPVARDALSFQRPAGVGPGGQVAGTVGKERDGVALAGQPSGELDGVGGLAAVKEPGEQHDADGVISFRTASAR